jgi:Mg2+-importing ATPase
MPQLDQQAVAGSSQPARGIAGDLARPPTAAPPVGPRRADVLVCAEMATAAHADVDAVLATLRSGRDGLSQSEAGRRLAEYGPNQVAQDKRVGWAWRLARAVRNPLVILLTVLATLAYATGDARAGTVMLLMVVLGVALRFVQESRADRAAARLKAMIQVTATVVRDGRPRELPLHDLVPGDLIHLAAGDMIPADVRLVDAKDLFVIQSSLTGESLPVEKSAARDPRPGAAALELGSVCYLGTSVESGAATAVVVVTGAATYFGGVAKALADPNDTTSFDRGVNRFTWTMIRLMAVMVPLVFVINGLTKHDWRGAFFFALAVAVGLTPEMLPMIIAVCLSTGAVAMSRKKVIVKRLSAIQNFGAMDVLCTDKTGTLTLDRVLLMRHCDVVCEESAAVLLDAYRISHFQTGLKNLLDRAILDYGQLHEHAQIDEHEKVDEIPFDFARRMMSVVVRMPGGACRILTKGAPEAVFERCTQFELDGEISPMNACIIDDLREEYERLSADGFRVLAVAYKDVEARPAYSKDDERDLTLRGYVAFLDPPKDSAAPAIRALEGHGISVKVLTGDNDRVTRKVCGDVGLPTDSLLDGAQVEAMSDEDLAAAAERTTLFARLAPAHKRRVVQALQRRGHVVGFMGDGINDAPALRAADVGISVDSAVDVAKASADLILLEKSLLVLESGVREGRKVFANILKYVRMGASSNFGNMFSILGASAFLPFVPMAPIQVLTNNLLYDFSQVPIPTDHLDDEQVARPRPWRLDEIRRFIFLVGPISSIFDYATFFVLLYLFGCWSADAYHTALFQTGWFVESLMSQTLIIHVIRTNRVPFLQSRPSLPLVATSAAMVALGAWLPFSPFAGALGFVRLPPLYWPLLLLTLFSYVTLTQWVKVWALRRNWI